jgi:hypothetical protein
MLRKLSLAAVVAAFSGFGVAGASAMPLAPADQTAEQTSAPEQATNPDLVLVADGCGLGFHRGPWGGCRPNLSPFWPCHWVQTPWGPRRVCR